MIDPILTPKELREIAVLSAHAARAVALMALRRDEWSSSNIARARSHGKTARAHRLEALRRSGKRKKLLAILTAR